MEDNNLNTLFILFIIKGILTLIVSLIFVTVLLTIGNAASQEFQTEEIPFNPATIISTMGVIGLIIASVITGLTFLAAKYIKERKNHTFIVVISILTCFSGILGLALGIFALVELHQSKVKPLFGRGVENDFLV